jgi:putative ABC transport system ATP-binding protein
MKAIISLRNVHKSYNLGRQAVCVLKGLSLDIAEGEFVALMGPCGSGKTALLNLIGGLDGPTAGEIEVAGQRIDRLADRDLARWRMRNVGVVLHNLLSRLDAAHNVELPLLLTSLGKARRMQKVMAALAAVGLQERARQRLSGLSAGEARRVAIALAMIADPRLLVCDEPTRDLDRATADGVMSLLQAANRRQGKTIVMVTRDQDVADYANRTLYLEKGVLITPLDTSSLPSPMIRRASAL